MPALAPARFPADREAVIALWREYQQHLNIDLEFQEFEQEVAAIPGKYAPPRGNIVLARDGDAVIGGLAWHPLTPEICEIKRFYVRPVARGHGIGKALLKHAMQAAQQLGYGKIYMDSLERLQEALRLYESFGFRRIAPYNDCPLPDVYHMEFTLCAEMV